jgi:hypothetical protein
MPGFCSARSPPPESQAKGAKIDALLMAGRLGPGEAHGASNPGEAAAAKRCALPPSLVSAPPPRLVAPGCRRLALVSTYSRKIPFGCLQKTLEANCPNRWGFLNLRTPPKHVTSQGKAFTGDD